MIRIARDTPFILLLLLGAAGCAATPDGPTAELDLGGYYLFEGTVAGQTVEGSLSFPLEGGWRLMSGFGVCDVNGSRWETWERRQRGNTTLSFRCEDLLLEIDTEDGEFKSPARATIRVQGAQEVQTARCQEWDEAGNCIRRATKVVPGTEARTGPVRLRRG